MRHPSHFVSLCAAVGGVLFGSTGCVSTKTYERDAAAPSVRVDQVLLPARPHLEATVTRSDGSLQLVLSRAMSCRRVENSTTRRERVEATTLGAGTYVSTGIFGLSGLVALGSDGGDGAGLVLLGIGGAILAIAAASTGETAAPLPPVQSSNPDGVEPCARTPLASAYVVVWSAGRSHGGTTDANGLLELEGVAAGPLQVVVEGESVAVAEKEAPFIRRPKSVQIGEEPSPADAGDADGGSDDGTDSTPNEAGEPLPPPFAPPSARPPVKKPPSPSVPVPLPPPPPPPPGARVK